MKSKLFSASLKQVMFNLLTAITPALLLIAASFQTGAMPDWKAVGFLAGGSVLTSLANFIRQYMSNSEGKFLEPEK